MDVSSLCFSVVHQKLNNSFRILLVLLHLSLDNLCHLIEGIYLYFFTLFILADSSQLKLVLAVLFE